jgi:hypothetical protein
MIGSFAIRSLRARRPDMSRGTATVHVMSTPAGSAAYSRWIYGLKGGLRLQAEKFIICTGGVSRRLPIPGFELTSTHSDAWRLTSIRLDLQCIRHARTAVRGGDPHPVDRGRGCRDRGRGINLRERMRSDLDPVGPKPATR